MAPKSKANGAGVKSEKSVPSTSGTATPITEAHSSGALTKPDKAAYDAEQDSLRKQIDAIQTKLTAVKEKISNGGRDEASTTRQQELKSQLDELKGHQATNKSSRGKLLDQIQALNDGVNKKIKDLNAARGKVPYKTSGEIDNRVQQLEKQVESGSMKISDEKRALAEIQSLKRSRRNVESFQKEQDAIDADREKVNAIRAQLDDPEYKAVSERYEAIKKELDTLRDEADVAYNNRNKLYDERNGYQAELDTLFSRKRELTQTYRETQDRYYAKVQEDRARRAERARVQRAEEEAEKKKAAVERIREEASIPAFQAQIEDCQTLIDYFSGKTNSAPVTNAGAALVPRKEIVGVVQHEARTVDAVPEGVIVRKKKGEDEETYFAGKAKKGGKNKKADAPVKEDGKLNLPLSTLSALLSMSIPPPVVPGDFPRVAEDLKTKKSWFEANQSRITSENIAKAESEIARILGKHANGVTKPTSTPSDITPANGGGEKPAEPASTPASSDVPSVPVPSDEVVDKLESVAEGDA